MSKLEHRFSPPESPIQRFAFYADESAITNARHSLVGGTAIDTFRLLSVYKRIWDLRVKHDMYAEFKWSKVSNQKLDAYRELIELYFDLVRNDVLSFHVTTFDNHKWKHQVYNQSDPDIGLSKNYYQLILHQFIKEFGDLASLFVCLDRRLSSTPLALLQKMLNAGATKEYGLSFGPVRTLVSRDSKKDDMLQINDVILGAVSAYKNGRHLEDGTRTSKIKLAILVRELSGLKSYDLNSPHGNKRFTLWNRLPR